MSILSSGALLGIWEWIRSFYMSFQQLLIRVMKNHFALLFCLISLFVKFVSYIADLLSSAFAKIPEIMSAAAVNSSAPSVGENALNYANTFFPLDSLVAWCGIYAGVVVALLVYRFIKSWLPTLSG